jgi:hypothetical protein
MHPDDPPRDDHLTAAERAQKQAEIAELEAQWEQDAVEPTRKVKATKRPPKKGGLD